MHPHNIRIEKVTLTMRKIATSVLITGAVILSACTVKVPTTPPEKCGQQICASAWAKCDGKQPAIILNVSSKNKSETPIKYTYKLVDSNGLLVEEGAGSKDPVGKIIVSQEIPFSGKTIKVHALSDPDDIALPITC